MIAPRHFPKAPIKEALIDIQVVLPENSTLEALNSKYVKITDAYPKHETLQRGQFGWQLNRGKTVQATVDDVGYRYTSSDGKHVVQFRRDGFTFSRLEPYDKWEQMRDEAARLWEHYISACTPTLITRVATRYVNVMKIPLRAELKQYLTAPPQIPEELNQELSSFLTRIEIREPSIEARGFLTQALESAQDEHAPILLDIDVFMNRQFEVDDETYWTCLEQLRNFKNIVFFESITEQAVELFQ